MRITALGAMLAWLPTLALAQQPAAPAEPIVQIGLYGYGANGSTTSQAYDSAPQLSSTVYLNGRRCLMGAGSRPAPPDATDVWQFAGKVVSSTSDHAVLQLEWRRTVANGLGINGGAASVQLSLKAGESVQLDQVGIESTPACETVAVGFEARYMPRFSGLGAGRGIGGSASAGGIAVSSPGSGGGGSRVPGSAGTSVTATASAGAGGGQPGGTGLFDVNLWLVRSVPGQPDEVTHSTLRMNADGASFAFAPLPVATSRGLAIVQVTGRLSVVRGASGEEQLVFLTTRRVGLTGAGQAPRDSAPDSSGSSRIINRMPGPEEVLAFEMPPIAVNGQTAAPDQLSVRLKIAQR